MTTLPLRAPRTSQFSVPGFARIGSFLSFIADVYGEALSEMRQANKKYPFAGV